MFSNFTRQKTNPSSFTNKIDYNALLISTVIIALNKWYVFAWVIIRFNGITPSRSWTSSLPPRPSVHTLSFYSTTSIRIPWTCGCIVSFDTTFATLLLSNYFHSTLCSLTIICACTWMICTCCTTVTILLCSTSLGL
jgi:hypothetical protein